MSVRAALISFLAAEGWAYEVLEKQDLVRVLVEASHGRWPSVMPKTPADDQLLIYGLCPHVVPADRRLAISELIQRANFGLPIGNFELDLDDGELRFKTSLDFEECVIEAAMIHHAFYANVAILDLHLPAIEAVLAGTDPREALARLSPPG